MTARITDDPVAISACYRFAPHWEIVMLGPTPFGRPPNERARLDIQAMFSGTIEEAEEDAWGHVRSVCAQLNYPFDEDEWDFVYVCLVNAN